MGGRETGRVQARPVISPSVEGDDDENKRPRTSQGRNRTAPRVYAPSHRGVKQVYAWLRPNQSHAKLRRAVARLRYGAMPSIDSRIPASVLADLLERSIEQDQLLREINADTDELRELEERLRRR